MDKQLPPLAPGSLTEGEKHHVRVMRAIDPEIRDKLMHMAELAFSETAQPKYIGAALRLVIDNDQCL